MTPCLCTGRECSGVSVLRVCLLSFDPMALRLWFRQSTQSLYPFLLVGGLVIGLEGFSELVWGWVDDRPVSERQEFPKGGRHT